MKKILSLCALFTFPLYVCLPIMESFAGNETKVQNGSIDKNLINKNTASNMSLNASNGNTSYDINYGFEWRVHTDAGSSAWHSTSDTNTISSDWYSIDMSRYAFNTSDILKKISFTIDLTDSRVISEAGNRTTPLSNPKATVVLPTPTTSENKEYTFSDEPEAGKDSDSIKGTYKIFYRNDNNKNFLFQIWAQNYAYNGGMTIRNTAAMGWAVINLKKVTVNVPYSLETIRNNITNAFKNYTLPYTSSTATTVLGNAGATNRSEIEAILRKQLSGHIPLGLYDSLNPQMWFTETPEKFINFKMVFVDPNTKKNNDASLWTWNVPIKFSLSPDYWQKSFWSRLSLSPGKISDASGIKLVDDTLEVIDAGQGVDNGYNGGHILYHTTTSLSFFELKNNDNADDYDSLSVNGIKLNGIDDQYQYNLIDNSVGDAPGKKTSD